MAIDHFLKLDFDFLSNEMTNIGITLHADADTDIHEQTAERCEIILIEYDTNYAHLSPGVMWSLVLVILSTMEFTFIDIFILRNK